MDSAALKIYNACNPADFLHLQSLVGEKASNYVAELLTVGAIEIVEDEAAPDQAGTGRRKFLEWIGKASAVPVLTSLALPQVAAASSRTLTLLTARYWNNKTDTPNTVISTGGGQCTFTGNNANCPGVDILAGLNTIKTTTSVTAPCTNTRWTDPCSGAFKECTVTYRCGGGPIQTQRRCENVDINITC